MQRGRHRDQAVISEDQQVAAPLEHTTLTNGRAQFPDADQRKRAGRSRVRSAPQDDLAFACDKREVVVNAVARVDSPGVKVHQMPAVPGNRGHFQLLRGAVNRINGQIPSVQRVLFDEPKPVLEQHNVNQVIRQDA